MLVSFSQALYNDYIPMADERVLEVKNLTKKFGSCTAVDDLSLEIKTGEVLGLLGRNGAGKTTTIQMLLGVMDATHGSIHYFGKPFPKKREEILKEINFASTYISMPWFFTVDEILEIYARLYEVKDRKKRIDKLLGEFEIEHLRKKQFSMLSAGEKTRLFLTKAFLNYPKVVLLDEPTANLDLAHQATLLGLVRQRCDDRGLAALVITHDINLAAEFADQVLLMKNGTMVAFGRGPEVFTPELIRQIFSVEVLVDAHPVSGVPRITPVHRSGIL